MRRFGGDMIPVCLHPLRIHPNAARVVVRHFPVPPESRSIDPAVDGRAWRIVNTLRTLDDDSIEQELALLLADFENRHREVRQYFEDRYDAIARDLDLPPPTRDAERALIGAYFCHEYSFEAAALMNPSVVPHPDQSGVGANETRFLMSLRAVGEGHISSITFREGILSADCEMRLSREPDLAVAACPEISNDGRVCLRREDDRPIEETVLCPVTPAQRGGLEDLRLVKFNDGKDSFFCGTYTAWSGHEIASEMLFTEDFNHFELRPVTGPGARDKGMALFPRRIGGDYAMIARQDNDNLFFLHSDDLTRWDKGEVIAGPRHTWELVQIGNCAPPVELDEGWLLLTHGVGAMRKYCIGAMLLDNTNPARVLGRSRTPLLAPSDVGREGYVPNVVYTCGALRHGDYLFMPFGIADCSVGFATIRIDALLETLV